MRRFDFTLPSVSACILLLAATGASAQVAPRPGPTSAPPAGAAANAANDPPLVKRLMAFDRNGDCKITKDEMTDPRLQPLFDQADTNGDGVVTREELLALAAKLKAADADATGPGGPDGPGGPPGFGGPDDRSGPPGGGPGGGPRPGRFRGPPPPGQILPPPVQDMLDLSDDQKRQLDALQKEVNQKLAAILTDEQNKQLAQMRSRAPGGRRGPGGPPPPDGQ